MSKATEIKNWTAEDAVRGGVLVGEHSGSCVLWQIACIHYDGSIEVTAMDIIKPNERHHWKFYRTQDDDGMP